MARIYEFPRQHETSDLEGSELKKFDPVTKRALIRFWISACGILIAAFMLYYFSRGRVTPNLAIFGALSVTICALILLFMMNRSLLSMHVLSKQEVKINLFIEKVLAQLDDRFAIFNYVTVEEFVIDHLVVGPSGVYVIKVSDTTDNESWERSGSIEQLLLEHDNISSLISRVLPDEPDVTVTPVLCVPTGTTIGIEQDDTKVWIVPANKIAASLIKRSSSEGAIGTNVNETGAFSSDALLSVAIERGLVNLWNIPTRKNRHDYTPPKKLTEES